ncbi:ceramide glucosyltransferase-B-like isoform X2 [Liolophura sinensis]
MYIMDEQTYNYVIFFLGVCGMVFYLFMAFLSLLSLIGSHFYLYRRVDPKLMVEEVPGVSIVKPLMGVDSLLEVNLESHFTLEYPKFELLICVQDDQDPAINLYNKMKEKYPKVDTRLFIGGKDGIINPMVHNMAPGYDNAKYDFIWISTSRIKASTESLYDMATKLMKPNVGLVHQLPFTTDQKGLAASVEKIYFGSNVGKFYTSFNFLGVPLLTGMSYIFKKSVLEEVNGLSWFGRYLAEDYFLSQAIHAKGYRIVLSAFPAQQNVSGLTLTGFKDRMVRWLRLRLNMITFVSGVMEPLAECFPSAVIGALCAYHFFGINPYYFFAGHVCGWIVLDYLHLCNAQGGSVPFSKLQFLLAWITRELINYYVYFEALMNPRRIKWGKRTYKVTLGGHTEIAREKGSIPL